MKRNDIGLILLAAGNSQRMGQCKFLLPMNDGITFFEHIIGVFSKFGVKKIVVVTQVQYKTTLETLCLKNSTNPILVINDSPSLERFYSLQLGIKALGDIGYSFIHNADSPFVENSTLALLYSNKSKADYLCPVFRSIGGHPILVNKGTLEHLLKCPANAILKEVLKTKKKVSVPVDDEYSTVDIDSPEEYKKYFN